MREQIYQFVPFIGEEEYQAIRECFESLWLTEGPKSKEFLKLKITLDLIMVNTYMFLETNKLLSEKFNEKKLKNPSFSRKYSPSVIMANFRGSSAFTSTSWIPLSRFFHAGELIPGCLATLTVN